MSEEKKPGSGRWVKIALAVSLALNLAVAGLIVGAVLGGGGPRGGEPGSPALRTLGLGPFAMALSRDDRRELRGRIENTGVEVRDERRAIGRSLRAVEEALRADPFDRARVEGVFETSRALVVSLQETGHTALLDQIETMSADERADLADGLARAMRRFGGRR